VIHDVCERLSVPADGVQVRPWRRPNLDMRVELLDSEALKRERLSQLLAK
jgi:hypothetical protein